MESTIYDRNLYGKHTLKDHILEFIYQYANSIFGTLSTLIETREHKSGVIRVCECSQRNFRKSLKNQKYLQHVTS